MPRNIKLTIEYNGTRFCGWQVQPLSQRTVQGEIKKALRIIFKKDILIVGSGRTDTGVHAIGQVASFKIDAPMPTNQIVRALNGNLDDDITILSAEEVPASFHAQFSAKRKTYQYTILNRSTRPAINKDFVLHVSHKINVSVMRNEAKDLVGRHNFLSFTATDPAKRNKPTPQNTIRTIHNLTIRKKKDIITIEVTANGFLYKMVRNITGTLLAIGTGLLPAGSMKKILKAKSRHAAHSTAPAKGLALINVEY